MLMGVVRIATVHDAFDDVTPDVEEQSESSSDQRYADRYVSAPLLDRSSVD